MSVLTDKQIFDAIRERRGAPLMQEHIDAINAIMYPEKRVGEMRVSQRGIDLIHSFEGLRLTAYPDPGTGGKPWTIGWGATTDEHGKPIQPNAVWSKERADARFQQHLAQFERGVMDLLDGTPVTQGQFDALVSFAYNVGLANLKSSTLLRKHKSKDYAGAAAEFARWNKAGGKVLRGLTRRREAEAKLYRG